MKILNPNYEPPSSHLEDIKAQIDDWFLTNAGIESVTFGQLRSYFVSNGVPSAENWSDGQIHGQLLSWGYEVVS